MVYSIVGRAARGSYDCIAQDNGQNAYLRIQAVPFIEFMHKRLF